jgi:Holliday junction resolvase RusA-like endonuclease
MTTIIRKPAFRVWIEGRPLSMQANGRNLVKYKQTVRDAVRAVIPHPTKSKRIGIEIYFRAQKGIRPDVDNIIKPILDALKEVVYIDDEQVRSVVSVALPEDDAYTVTEYTSIETINRLTTYPPKEFMVDIYEGLAIYSFPP